MKFRSLIKTFLGNAPSLFHTVLFVAAFAFLPVLAFASPEAAPEITAALSATAEPAIVDATLQVKAGGGQVEIGGAAVGLIGLIFAALGAGLKGLLGLLFGSKGKIPLPDQTRFLLEQAIQTGLSLAEAKLKEKAAGLNPIELKSDTVAAAANFVLAAAPQAVALLGLTEDKVKEMVGSQFDKKKAAA